MKPLDLSTVTLSPAEAAKKNELDPKRFRVEMFYDGRPIYRFGNTKVYADTGGLVDGANALQAVDIVKRWVPQYQSTVRYDAYLEDSDQWTLQQAQRQFMPLHRISVGDPAGTNYYVSEDTGELVMKTDRRGRFWGFWSAVLHWTYFTPLPAPWPILERLDHVGGPHWCLHVSFRNGRRCVAFQSIGAVPAERRLLLGVDADGDGDVSRDRPGLLTGSLDDLFASQGHARTQILVPRSDAQRLIGLPSNPQDPFTSVACNALRSPNVQQIDLSLIKRISLHEGWRMNIEANAFNVLNRAQFGAPVSTLTDVRFGQVLAIRGGTNPRQLQFGVKLTF